MDVVFTLSTLLFNHNRVVVNGLGVFTTEEEKAYIHPVEHSFTPEFKKIKFQLDVKNEDDLLIKSLNSPNAAKAIEEFVAKVHQGLKAGNKVQFKNIGYLYTHHTGEVILEQDRSFNYVKKNFGLQGFIQNPVNKVVASEEPIAKTIVVAKKKSKRLVLIILWLVAIALAGVAFWQAENIGSLFTNSPVTDIPEEETVAPESNVEAIVESDSTNIDTITLVDSSTISEDHDSMQNEVIIADDQHVEVVEEELPAVVPVVEEQPKAIVKHKGPRYYVIAGCFESKLKAESMLQELHEAGYDKAVLDGKIGRLHRVSYDVFAVRAEASNYMLKLKRDGRKGVWIQKK